MTAHAPDLGGILRPEILVADDWRDFALLDSGDGRKLERYGAFRFDRPEPQAFWPAASQDWRADARFQGADGEEQGRWRIERPLPDFWPMRWEDLTFAARCTPFRHLGVFPEHSVHWRFARERMAQGRAPSRILNLFGYTGLASLACARDGAEVTHVDASKKAIGYARENQALSGLAEARIRWICDDALAFTAREARRERRYDGVFLDPPKHGRGPNGEVWTLEEGLLPLLSAVRSVLSDDARFVVLTVYAVRLSYVAVAQALAAAFDGLGGSISCGEMTLPHADRQRLLPTAIYARWTP